MKSQRRAFTPEFKDEVVKLEVNIGRPNRTSDLRNSVLRIDRRDSTCRLTPCPRKGCKATTFNSLDGNWIASSKNIFSQYFITKKLEPRCAEGREKVYVNFSSQKVFAQSSPNVSRV
jgi:hypothetical protein